MKLVDTFNHHLTEAGAVSRLKAGVAKLQAEHGDFLTQPPTFSEDDHTVHLVISHSGAQFDVNVTVDPTSVEVKGTENLIGHLAQNYVLGLLEDFFA